MKFLYIVVSLFVCTNVFAQTLLTSCPSGYTSLTEKQVDIVSGTCPSGYANTTSNVIACPSSGTPSRAECWLVSYTDTDYSDTTGTYQFTQPCPYDNSGGTVM